VAYEAAGAAENAGCAALGNEAGSTAFYGNHDADGNNAPSYDTGCAGSIGVDGNEAYLQVLRYPKRVKLLNKVFTPPLGYSYVFATAPSGGE
jgi:hypothetical protein